MPHQDLLDLYARYCHVIDANDSAALADCFTEDGVFWITGQGRFEGRDEIMGLVGDTSVDRPRHHTLNVWVEKGTNSEAQVKAYFQILDQETAETAAWGHYEDRAVLCDDGAWRWRERRVYFEWTSRRYASQPGRGRVVPLE